VGNIFYTRFIEAKVNLEENMKKLTVSVLGLRRKRQLKNLSLNAKIGR